MDRPAGKTRWEIDLLIAHRIAAPLIWQNESQHALLHHLNAIFGYEAMILREQSWKSF
jgi:hypothetical protein